MWNVHWLGEVVGIGDPKMLGPALGLTRMFYHCILYISVASGDFFNQVCYLLYLYIYQRGQVSRVELKVRLLQGIAIKWQCLYIYMCVCVCVCVCVSIYIYIYI